MYGMAEFRSVAEKFVEQSATAVDTTAGSGIRKRRHKQRPSDNPSYVAVLIAN